MFQQLMGRVLTGLLWETCLVYLNDIIVLGRDATKMLEWLSQVYARLCKPNLKLKPSKCCLFREQVAYLGHIVSVKGVATDPQKVQKVVEWPTPQNISEAHQFVGLASYYRCFVEIYNTDASDWGIGAVLSQVQVGKERVLAYGSRRLSATEQNYWTTRPELLAAVEFTFQFRQ